MASFITAATEGAIRQGELLSGVLEIVPTPGFLTGENQSLIRVTHDYLVVISQDCDLDWDHKARYTEADAKVASKLMASILCCKVDTAKDVRDRSDVNARTWERIRINKDERYHFLEAAPSACDAQGQDLPELCIDFKTYIGIPAEILYCQVKRGLCRRRGRLVSPYLEHLSQRFSGYLSRVALPEEHRSRPEG